MKTRLTIPLLAILSGCVSPKYADIDFPGYLGHWRDEAIGDFHRFKTDFGMPLIDFGDVALIELRLFRVQNDDGVCVSEYTRSFPADRFHVMLSACNKNIPRRLSRLSREHGRFHVAQVEAGYFPEHWDLKILNDRLYGWKASASSD